MGAVVGAANDAQLQARHITDALFVNEHDAVLLKGVPFAGHKSRRLFAVGQTNQNALSIGGVGFLRLTNQRLQDDAAHLLLTVKWMAPLELRLGAGLVDPLQELVLVPLLLGDGQLLGEAGHILVLMEHFLEKRSNRGTGD